MSVFFGFHAAFDTIDYLIFETLSCHRSWKSLNNASHNLSTIASFSFIFFSPPVHLSLQKFLSRHFHFPFMVWFICRNSITGLSKGSPLSLSEAHSSWKVSCLLDICTWVSHSDLKFTMSLNEFFIIFSWDVSSPSSIRPQHSLIIPHQ